MSNTHVVTLTLSSDKGGTGGGVGVGGGGSGAGSPPSIYTLTADFDWSASALTVNFSNTSTRGPSGPITGYLWDFGDGNTSTAQSPSHTYASPGTYSVTLTVTGSGSDGTASVDFSVSVVSGVAPNAAFTFSASALAVTFTDTSTAGSSGPITGWSWDFGDGNTSTSQSPSHTYAAAGTYSVALTITGTSPDGTDSVTHSVTVVASVGGSSFISVTSFARPSFTVVRNVPFTTKAGLDSAIANMQTGDLIHYAGTGVLTISSATTNAYTIASKNPAGPVQIDFGCSHNQWDTSKISGNYVRFEYTGSGLSAGVWLNACSNLRIYGGDIGPAGVGIAINAPSHDILWWDAYIHNILSSGVSVKGTTSSGVTSDCHNLDVRAEVYRWSMNPGLDNHPDKGTGFHACILHGNTGAIHDSRFVIDGHDPLLPGETSVGKVWPEGGGGSVIEQGNGTAANYNNVTMYARGRNCLMQPNGTNPGSTAQQTGGNVINLWGNIPLNGNVIGWVEGTNCTGAVVHGSPGGSWWPGSPPITVQHGRHTNTNQFVGSGGNVADPYVQGKGIVYDDCT